MRSSIKLAFAVGIFAIAGSCLLAAKKTSQLQATAKRFVSDGNATVVWVSAVVRVDVSVAGRSYPSQEQKLETEWDEFVQEKENALQKQQTEEVSVEEETESSEEAVEAPKEEIKD